MLFIKYKRLINDPIYIYLESYYKEIYKKLYIYLFKNLYVKFDFLYLLKNKKYFLSMLKIKPLTRVYKFYKKKRKKFTVPRAPFVFKKSKEQFEVLRYKYLLKTNLFDFYYFLYLLKSKFLSRLNIKYKAKIVEKGTICF